MTHRPFLPADRLERFCAATGHRSEVAGVGQAVFQSRHIRNLKERRPPARWRSPLRRLVSANRRRFCGVAEFPIPSRFFRNFGATTPASGASVTWATVPISSWIWGVDRDLVVPDVGDFPDARFVLADPLHSRYRGSSLRRGFKMIEAACRTSRYDGVPDLGRSLQQLSHSGRPDHDHQHRGSAGDHGRRIVADQM